MRNVWKYKNEGELCVREISIDSGKGGGETVIVHLTDLHYKDCTQKDLADPVLASTYEHRWAFDTSYTVPNARSALDYADRLSPSQIVITGDALDYLSEGSLELLKREVWDRYRDADGKVRRVLVTLGNHEPLRQMQGTVDETVPLEDRIRLLEERWEHDIYYESRVLDEKVMVIGIDDSSRYDAGNPGFYDFQIEPLRRDIKLAREKGYVVLIFCHVPLATRKEEDKQVEASVIGDKNGRFADLCHGGVGPWCSDAARTVYELICSSADVVKGVFCGHDHNDYYCELDASTPSGERTVIPQYILVGTPYQKGHVFKITVK